MTFNINMCEINMEEIADAINQVDARV